MASESVHDKLKPLAWLVGNWTGEGTGEYPTMASFTLRETLSISTDGRPFLLWNKRSKVVKPDGTEKPAHAEMGFVKVSATAEDGSVAVHSNFSHVTGFVEVEEGSLSPAGDLLTLDSEGAALGSTSISASPKTTRVRRELAYNAETDEIVFRTFMATQTTEELTLHLTVTFKRDA
eukprot:PLAT13750.1.p1 GENE.PLAT13750.1~~PLAT13750.1.p1  ORF type:complete len:176 (+),score=76.02 PLAT13750.1:63-590(+)